MKHRKNVLLAAILVAALVPVMAVAETSADARAWIEKMAGQKTASLTADYTFDATLSQNGQSMKLAMTGKMMQKDGTHLRMEMDAAMTLPGMDEPMNMEMVNVKDGSTMWVQIKNPMMGQQVMKLDLAKMDSIDPNNPMMKNIESADVIGQVRSLIDKGDFAVTDESSDSVTLSSTVTAPMVEGFGGKMEDLPEDARTITVVLDKKTAFPKELRLGGDEPLVRFAFENVEFTDSFAEGTFSYTPPEGVTVMDLAAMAGMGG